MSIVEEVIEFEWDYEEFSRGGRALYRLVCVDASRRLYVGVEVTKESVASSIVDQHNRSLAKVS